MIPRYERSEISQIWSDDFKFQTYLQVELAILKAQEGDFIPVGTSEKIAQKAQINPQRISEIENTVRHDVIAFCTSITENLDAKTGRLFHYGVTSSDIIDTATTLQVKASLDHVLPALDEVVKILWKKANEYKKLVSIGRSHGMYAEPMSFGQKILGHFCEFARRLSEYQDYYQNQLTGQFSGAVGNYTIIKPEAEKKALDSLGLKVEPVSTQVIPRDRLAKLINLGSLTACAIERLATEIRHLHRSDVDEVEEGFKAGQKGSSIMPHKKNPISGENLTGMARVLRSHSLIAMENVTLWHERDISHSSAERLMLPDHFGLLVYALKRLTSTMENLVVKKDTIQRRVQGETSYLSSYYLHYLLKHTELKREDLYPVAQEAAFKAKEGGDFFSCLQQIGRTRGIDVDQLPKPQGMEIEDLFLDCVDEVFSRVEKEYLK